MTTLDGLPIHEFRNSDELRAWLEDHHDSSEGMWLRIYKKNTVVQSVTFEQVLDEGLCFGWSESKRLRYDRESYLQRFTPRKTVGTQSPRNLARAESLVEKGKMKPSGLRALGTSQLPWKNGEGNGTTERKAVP
jgi:uncharacterized protein YdeI (YjbR/CyaY-like superfamily)